MPAALPMTSTSCTGRSSSGGTTRNMSHSPPVSTVCGRHTDCSLTPSLSSRCRASPTCTTRTYWYGDSASNSGARSFLIAPGGTSSNPIATAGTAIQRTPASEAPAMASSAAAPIMVRCVPIQGIVSSAGRKVPAMLPVVDNA